MRWFAVVAFGIAAGPRAADNFEFFADYIGVMAGETFQQMAGYQTVVTRQPAGVAALFAPWNAPLALASMQIASAIAFGNTCVLKPSNSRRYRCCAGFAH